MLAGVSSAAWQVVHRWLGRAFLVTWVVVGVQLVRHDWKPGAWYVPYLVLHGAVLAAGGRKDAAQRRAIAEHLERIDGRPHGDQPEAPSSS